MNFNVKYFLKRIHNKLNYYKTKNVGKYSCESISDSFNSRDYVSEDFQTASREVEKISQFLLSPKDKKRIIDLQKTIPNASISENIKEADLVCTHIIKVLGKDYYLGDKINWHKDYLADFVWPLKFYRDIEIINLSDDSDIKIPWEISRFHQAVVLGKAYWCSGDERYAIEFIGQLESWVAGNPPNKGINWNCTMEVSIRAINLIWGYFFFINSQKFTNEVRIRFFNLVLAHGKHIYRNLENKGIVNGNHYLANLLGLLYISSIFPVFRLSRKWKQFSFKQIIKEMKFQVYPDGTNFESSTSYHHLVTEIFFHAAHLLTTLYSLSEDYKEDLSIRDISNDIFGSDFTNKLEKMFEYILYYTEPNGLSPQIGDNDCGRILIFGAFSRDFNNHTHLLAVAGEFFDRNDFRFAGNDRSEDAVWLFKRFSKLKRNYKPRVTSKAFKNSGIFIMRNDEDYMIVRCGKLGTGGKGTHTHNDNLSFELCSDGTRYLIDPGTYVYSGNPKLRNIFRSTEYHNTLVVDGREQNDFNEDDLFSLHKRSKPRLIAWETRPYQDIFIGDISFLLNARDFVRHRRKITFDKRFGKWVIVDSVYGNGEHLIAWYFHLDVGVKAIERNDSIILSRSDRKALIMTINQTDLLEVKSSRGWYSPSYGVIKGAQVLTLLLKTTLPRELTFSFQKK